MADRTLNVKISGDTSSLSRALGRASHESQTFGGRMRSHVAGGMLAVGKASLVAGAAVGTGIVAGLALSVKQAMEAQKVQAQTAAVLKSTGGAAHVSGKQVNDMADSLSMLSGVDDEAVQSSENLLLTFRNIHNQAGKGNDIFNQATKATLDLSVAMHKDLNSSSVLVGKALNDPVKGLTALTRVGVSFSKKQQDIIKRLAETGHTAEAQKLILGELNKEFGGSAKAAGDTFSGSLGKAKVALGNLGEVIGGAMLPVLTQLATQFAVWVQELQKSKTAHEVMRSVLHALAAAFNFVKSVVGSVAGFIRKHWDQIRSAVASAANFIRTQVLPRLRAAFLVVKQVVGNLAKSFMEAWPDIKKAVIQAWNAMKPSLHLLGKILSEVIAPALIWLSKHSGPAFKALAKAVQASAWIIGHILEPLGAAIEKIIDGMKWILSHLGAVKDAIGSVVGGGASPIVHPSGPHPASQSHVGGNVYLDGKLVGRVLRDGNRSYGRGNAGRSIISPT